MMIACSYDQMYECNRGEMYECRDDEKLRRLGGADMEV